MLTILFILIALVVAAIVCFTLYSLFVSRVPARRLLAWFKEFMDCDWDEWRSRS